MNCGLTATIQRMRSLIYYSVLASGLVFVLAFAFGKASGEEQREALSLPDSCTLMSMAPAERSTHLARLAMLRRSASGVKVSSEGFSFEVDLALISWPIWKVGRRTNKNAVPI